MVKFLLLHLKFEKMECRSSHCTRKPPDILIKNPIDTWGDTDPFVPRDSSGAFQVNVESKGDLEQEMGALEEP